MGDGGEASHGELAPAGARPPAVAAPSSATIVTTTAAVTPTVQEEKTGFFSPPESQRVTPRPTYVDKNTLENGSHGQLPRRNSLDLDGYFKGPRNLTKHSKLPLFLRIQGSVMPRLIIPLGLMLCWSTLITCLTRFVHDLGVDSILLTILGFLVGLSLSFRSSTAYERYAEGRKYWATLLQNSRNLARVIWIYTEERPGEDGKEDIISKLTGLNLILAFAISLKHKLRFEPDSGYDDLSELIGHLDTFAKDAHDPAAPCPRAPGKLKAVGQYLSVPMAMSNPRKQLKRSIKPLGNLPVEILSYISAYTNALLRSGSVPIPMHQTQMGNSLAAMEEVMTGAERVLNTPLPLAYSILISQITWIYVAILPFQLVNALGWVAIPAAVVATYIIQGIASTCAEIENPFGNDVNDLPLDVFCEELATDLDIITATAPAQPADFINHKDNLVLYPLSKGSVDMWKDRSVEDIRAALRAKATVAPSSVIQAGSRDKLLLRMRKGTDGTDNVPC